MNIIITFAINAIINIIGLLCATFNINSDGKADISDLSEISLAILGDKVFTEAQKEAADVDGDGEMTLADFAKFRQYITKQIEWL